MRFVWLSNVNPGTARCGTSTQLFAVVQNTIGVMSRSILRGFRVLRCKTQSRTRASLSISICQSSFELLCGSQLQKGPRDSRRRSRDPVSSWFYNY
eukprot:1622037-Rhodomonas_salina.3